MFKRKKLTVPKGVKDIDNADVLKGFALSNKLHLNCEAINKIFKDNDTIITRNFVNQFDERIKGCIIYTDGMVNNLIVNQNVLQAVEEKQIQLFDMDLADCIGSKFILSNQVEKTDNFEKIIGAIVYGDTVMLFEGTNTALLLNTKGFTLRGISEPDGERILSGPREGFCEGLLTNLSLLRRRLSTEKLKMKYKTLGFISKTRACICYIDGIADQKIVDEVIRRVDSFNLDGCLDTNYIAEFIKDHRFSPFKTVGTTERPDVVAGKLLEGRIAIFLDGTPVVLTVPFIFAEYFQSNEDYYINYFFSSFIRLFRYFGFFLTIITPAFYLSITTFHFELLPTPLLMSLITSRKDVPLPTIVELFLMLVVFELLRESGVRMNSNVGQALSIVGALVIGTAAVEAKLISAPMVIIVGLTGITGLLIPKLKSITILTRYTLIAITAFMGIYGFMIGLVAFLLYAFSIRSFGIQYLSDPFTLNFQKNKDLLIRVPWTLMKQRPNYFTNNQERQSKNG